MATGPLIDVPPSESHSPIKFVFLFGSNARNGEKQFHDHSSHVEDESQKRSRKRKKATNPSKVGSMMSLLRFSPGNNDDDNDDDEKVRKKNSMKGGE